MELIAVTGRMHCTLNEVSLSIPLSILQDYLEGGEWKESGRNWRRKERRRGDWSLRDDLFLLMRSEIFEGWPLSSGSR